MKSTPVEQLLDIMSQLRDPDGGCPWDLEQTFSSIAPFTIEEAYEVDDAIRREQWSDLRDELGDLLLQVVFHAQLAREAGRFDFAEVVTALCEKLVRRHPHVFGGAKAADAEEVLRAWELHKAAERAAQGARGAELGVPLGMPALLRAAKLAKRARQRGVEVAPSSAEVARVGALPSEALGDFLFACAAAAGARGIDAEAALREACARFEARVTRELAEE
jgi:MazG family protein